MTKGFFRERKHYSLQEITDNLINLNMEETRRIPPILDQCIRNIFEVRKITSELQKNTSWEKVMVEKIVNSVNGQGKFDEFTKNDIDDVIKMFQELQTKVEG